MEEPSFSASKFVTAPTDSTEAITCAAASAKFVVLGRANGSISLYDVFGNRLDHHDAVHTGAVTAVGLGGGPAADQVIASASHTLQLRAARFFTGKSSGHADPMLSAATISFSKRTDAVVTAVAVDPSFGKPRFGDRIAYADIHGRVAFYTAGWFGGSDLVISESQDFPIVSLSWVNNLLAFPGPDGVRVYDTRMSRFVCLVAPPGANPKGEKISLSPTVVAVPAPQTTTQKKPPEQGQLAPSVKPAPSVAPAASQDSLSVLSESNDQATSPSSPGASMSALLLPPSAKSTPAPPPIPNRSSSRWALHTRTFMQTEEPKPSAQQQKTDVRTEPATLLFVTWPDYARVVRIGPYVERNPPDPSASRDIDVVSRFERPFLINSEVLPNFEETSLTIDSPLLSLVPFDNRQFIALVGTPIRTLFLHLVTGERVSVKTMPVPHDPLHDAFMLTVPGGDPLILLIAYPQPKSTDENGNDDASVQNQYARSATIMYVRSRTTAERVTWFLGQNRFQDALQVAQSARDGSLRRAEVSLEDVGEQFLESLRDEGDFLRLAAVLPETISTTSPAEGFRSREKVMKKRKRRWVKWIQTFRQASLLPLIAPCIPTEEPRLEDSVYSDILVELVRVNPKVMLEVLKTWRADVFSVSTVTKAIEEHLARLDQAGSDDQQPREPLGEGLLMMYGLSGRHDETLNLLLREKSTKVYEYIESHHLYEAVRSVETIKGLYTINAASATNVLSHAPETVLPADAVVPILNKVSNPRWTFMYLHAVFTQDPEQAPKYHNQLLKLYVEYGDAGTLYHFLRTSTQYSLDRALVEMGGPKGTGKGQLAKERVYVLSAMGDLNSALDILLEELGDTVAAIEFASDHGDKLLWERLIEHARTHAATLAALLDSPAGGKVDPERLIPLLSSDMKIPHLRDRLHRILVDAALERALREDAAAALHHDTTELLRSLDDSVSYLPA